MSTSRRSVPCRDSSLDDGGGVVGADLDHREGVVVVVEDGDRAVAHGRGHDAVVSRRHAEFRRTTDGFTVSDVELDDVLDALERKVTETERRPGA